MEEIWKPLIYRMIVTDLYEISNYGQIRNIKTSKILKPCISEKGYYMVTLKGIDGRHHTIKLHRIVAKIFVPGETRRKNEVNHKDGDKSHNCAWNLEWCTRRYNMHHAYENNLVTVLRGEMNGMNIYSEDTVRLVCELLVSFKGSIIDVIDYMQYLEIPADKNLVQDIKYKKRWKHISDGYFKKDDFKH